MARYDVYGVGNALVDLEYRIAEDFLTEHGVDKSLMTLIEEDRHHELLEALGDHGFERCGGGSAANTITSCAKLGARTFYSCKVADDAHGRFFVGDLDALGVDSNLTLDTLPDGLTGKCIVLITPDGERSMNTFLGITRELSPAAIDVEAVHDSGMIYIEGYLVPETHARQAALDARDAAQAAGVPVALTLSDVNMVKFFRDGLEAIIGDGVDLVFANEAEAMLLVGADSAEGCIEPMKRLAKRFAITRGERGALLWDGSSVTDISAEVVTPVDANGAGDVYAGTFMVGLARGLDFARCGEMAGTAATRLITRFGARLDTEELNAIAAPYLS